MKGDKIKLVERVNAVHKMIKEGRKPKLFEYDGENKIVDIFVRNDPDCPIAFSVTNTDDIWYRQGFYLTEFIEYLRQFFHLNGLPYKIDDDELPDIIYRRGQPYKKMSVDKSGWF